MNLIEEALAETVADLTKALDKAKIEIENCKSFDWQNAMIELTAERDTLRAENEKHQEIFSWLLGENGEFPESTPGKRYGFRTELRKRLAQSLLSGSNKSCEVGK